MIFWALSVYYLSVYGQEFSCAKCVLIMLYCFDGVNSMAVDGVSYRFTCKLINGTLQRALHS